MERDFCEIKIELAEKPIKDFYKQMIVGDTPPFFSYILTEYLQNKYASYNEIRHLQPFLHETGRKQQSLMFSRRCMAKWLEYRKNGFYVELKLIKERLLEEEAQKFEDEFGYIFKIDENEKEERIKKRKELFLENQKK